MMTRSTPREEVARRPSVKGIEPRSQPHDVASLSGPPRGAPEVDTFLANWIVQARKGLLELSVLHAVEVQERYGYEIVRDMVARPGLGGAEGTIYPMLARLRDHGLLATSLRESEEGPVRKYYSLTPAGHVALASMRERFRELISGVLREGEEPLPPGAIPNLRRVAN